MIYFNLVIFFCYNLIFYHDYCLESLNRPFGCSKYFSYVLDGVPRMRERPIGDLVVGLKQLGADVDCVLGTNCPPVRVNGKGGLPGGKVWLDFL